MSGYTIRLPIDAMLVLVWGFRLSLISTIGAFVHALSSRITLASAGLSCWSDWRRCVFVVNWISHTTPELIFGFLAAFKDYRRVYSVFQLAAFFLTRDSMLSALYAIARPYVRPSFRLSHGWISQKRLKLGSCNFHRTVAPSL